MLKQINKSREGFTIIEVLIVLAIAGLIMLIVFLAVPALQRNSRNTQRRSDVGRIGSAVQEVLTNNNGQVSAITTANVRAAVGNLSFYAADPDVTVGGAASGTVTNNASISQAVVYTNAVCAAFTSDGGNGATSSGATSRSIAVVYKTEPDNLSSRNCTSL